MSEMNRPQAAAPQVDAEKASKAQKLTKKERKREQKKTQKLANAQAQAQARLHGHPPAQREPMAKRDYEKELQRLQIELVKLQYWVKHKGLKVVLIFEGPATQPAKAA